MAIDPISVGEPVEYVIPATGLSLDFVVDWVRKIVGGNQLRVSGSLLSLDGQVQSVIIIERSGDNEAEYLQKIDQSMIDTCGLGRFRQATTETFPSTIAQISCAAEFVMKYTQPYILASYYRERGLNDSARDLLNSMLINEPKADDHWALNLLGTIAREEANKRNLSAGIRDARREEALDLFDQAERAFSDTQDGEGRFSFLFERSAFPLVHHNRGLLLWDEGRLDAAEKELLAATEENPAYGLAYSALGDLMAQRAGEASSSNHVRDFWADAERYYQRGLISTRNGSQKANILERWARALWNRKKNDSALRKVDLAIGADPAFAPAYDLKGEILLQNSQQDINLGASAAFAKSAELEPWNAKYRAKYAKSLRGSGDIEGSIVEYERVVQLEPNEVNYRVEYAKTLAVTIGTNKERYNLAIEQLYEAYAINMKVKPGNVSQQATIEDQLLLIIDRFVEGPAGLASSGTSFRRIETEYIQAGDKLLRAGYLEFAGKCYRRAVERVRESPSGNETLRALIDAIVKKLTDAIENTESAQRRSILLDLVRSYRRDDMRLNNSQFLNLIDLGKFDEARVFASLICGGRRLSNEVVVRWFGDWKCPAP